MHPPCHEGGPPPPPATRWGTSALDSRRGASYLTTRLPPPPLATRWGARPANRKKGDLPPRHKVGGLLPTTKKGPLLSCDMAGGSRPLRQGGGLATPREGLLRSPCHTGGGETPKTKQKREEDGCAGGLCELCALVFATKYRYRHRHRHRHRRLLDLIVQRGPSLVRPTVPCSMIIAALKWDPALLTEYCSTLCSRMRL